MSIALPKNPVPKKVWNRIRKELAQYHVILREGDYFGIIDAVGDEYATIAVLYVEEAD